MLNKQEASENTLSFANPSQDGSSKQEDIEIIAGEETESENATYSSQDGNSSKALLAQINFSKIENSTTSFEKYAYISGDLVMDENGIIRVSKDAIGSKNIKRHSIESENIDGNSITSGKIKNNSVLGKDINRETEITVAEIIADDIAGLNLAITQSIDLGANRISDGLFSGNWDFGSGNLTTSGTISGSFAGSFAPSGDVDMTNHIFTNIGNTETDFTSAGGLDLAGTFNVNSGNLYVDTSTGNVGIGTTIPEYKLQVLGNVTVGNQSGVGVLSFHNDPVANSSARYAGITKDFSSSMSFNFYSSGSITGSTADYNFYTGNRSQDLAVVIKGSGNVGIGTTSPGQKLDVNGNINTSGDLMVTNSDPTLVFASTSVGALTGAIHQSGNILSLGTLGLTDMFSLDLTTGYVGIGTTTPLANLDINGDLRLSPQTTAPDTEEGKVYYDGNDKSYKLYNTQETVAGEYIDLVADPHIQPSECPTGYVPVPGDARYGTAGGFCVMKYEAKCAETADPTTGLTSPNTGYQTYCNDGAAACTGEAGGGADACTTANGKAVVSVASGYPIANISQTDAKAYCSALGTGYHLITNNEWMTMARNAERIGTNWTSGTVGTNGLYRGHTDNVPATALPANSDDSQGYEGTGQSAPSEQKRTFAFSNGEVIWDLSGNVWEWNQDTIKRKDQPHSTTTPDNTFSWKEFTTVDDYGTMSYASMRPSNPSWNATQNMGRLYTYNPSGDTDTTQYAFKRGGRWDSPSDAGLFALHLNGTPASTSNSIGLRCVFTP